LGLFRQTVSDARLRDFAYMASTPIGHFFPLRGTADTISPGTIVITTINRLCHLIERMERTPNDITACFARWYDKYFEIVPILPDYRVYVGELRARLMRAVVAHDERVGYWADPDHADRLIGSDERSRKRILYGSPLSRFRMGTPVSTTPEGKLIWVVSEHCWRTGIDI
jgi:hypothetical protein